MKSLAGNQKTYSPALWLFLALMLLLAPGCGLFGSDGPSNLGEAKKRMEERVHEWCDCYLEAQKKQRDKAKETTNCMNLLPGGKFEMKMAASADLNADEARELRSHAIQYRRKVEAECRAKK